MTRPLGTAVALMLTVAVGACADSEASSSTAETTRGLLTQTPSASAGPAGNAGTIDVATLGFDMGSSDAPIRVVEMSDFGCTFCRQFHMQTFSTLFDEFIETGKVEWKFMPFITGMFDNSLAATEAAECALEQSPALFRSLSNRLWTNQSEWKSASPPEPMLRAMAADAGVDLDGFDACVADDRSHQRIGAATQLAGQLGVRGTPTFFVIGYPPLQGALPTETFRDILNAVHADATGGGG